MKKTVGSAPGGEGENKEFVLGYAKFEMPLNIQMEMLRKQLNVSLEFRAEVEENINLGVGWDRWRVKPQAR